jgi:hypothetical protein
MDEKAIARRVAKSMVAAPKLKEYQEMKRLMSSLSKWGATDTEPRYHLSVVLVDAIKGRPYKDQNWELFSSVPGWKGAQQKLNRQAKKLYNAIQNASFREVRELADWEGIDL